MHFDFNALLVILTIISGGIVYYDKKISAKNRDKKAADLALQGLGPEEINRVVRMPAIAETARAFFPVILIVLVLRSFIVEPFRIPSGSMMPTLLPGDFILVNKFSYGLR
ncbi:MAG: signal peptidase I, partial [Gammaproteobacteria bacterium]|nr:signal peptidase I [Gammaproteobacteria bacterium]